ncbi:unnamed protein product [Schistocephalus solidus]|uniref:Uncharacterized protein n=1 Tax=Schistocephalus solidus TaxID=70667 RepID=A0A183TAK0_SCHSO|nr:unnamed protein product [Schistocephalus solidus]
MSLNTLSKGALFNILPDSEDSSRGIEAKENSASDATVSTITPIATTARSRFCSPLWCTKSKAHSRAKPSTARSRGKKSTTTSLRLPEDEIVELKQCIEQLAQKVHSDNETIKKVIRESLASAKSSSSSSFSSTVKRVGLPRPRELERSSSVSSTESLRSHTGPQGERGSWRRRTGIASNTMTSAVLGALNEVNETVKDLSKDILQVVDMRPQRSGVPMTQPITRTSTTTATSTTMDPTMMRVLTEIKDGVNALDKRLRVSSVGNLTFKGRPSNQTDYILLRKLEEIRESLQSTRKQPSIVPPATSQQAWDSELLSELKKIRKSLRSLEDEERQPTLTQLQATGTPYMLISRK